MYRILRRSDWGRMWEKLHKQKFPKVCLPCMKGRRGGVSWENVGLEHEGFFCLHIVWWEFQEWSNASLTMSSIAEGFRGACRRDHLARWRSSIFWAMLGVMMSISKVSLPSQWRWTDSQQECQDTSTKKESSFPTNGAGITEYLYAKEWN